jgi:ribonuclease VapC
MIFADASALVAVIAKEPDAVTFLDVLEREKVRLCSALSIWESISGICRSYNFPVALARRRVESLLKLLDFRLVAIGQRELEIAAEAYARFGKGRHPAALNMGDCFAYACARANEAKLLFKGDDFSKTDIASALE